MALKGNAATLKLDKAADLAKLVGEVTRFEVLVGFPEDTAERKDDSAATNASLAYIHDNGAPENNIPARPFMGPGIASAEDPIAQTLGAGLRAFLKDGNASSLESRLHRVGLKAQLAIRRKINEGVPPPLAESTLRARANRSGKGLGSRKGAKLELELRAAGWTPSVDFAKPLVDTGQLRNAVSYAIRPRKARRK